MTAASPLAPEIRKILQVQEMRGERLVNHVRAVITLLSLGMLAAATEINTPAANRALASQGVAFLVYTVLIYGVLYLRPNSYYPTLKYQSIFFDLTCLHFTFVAMSLNHSGPLEYFYSFIPLYLVLWQFLSALRFSVRACIFSAVVSLVWSSTVLTCAVAWDLVPVKEFTAYALGAINVMDESIRVAYIAVSGIAAAGVAHIGRQLIQRAEEESMRRAEVERQKDYLAKYLSKDLAELVLKEPHRMELGGTRQEAAILFADVRNFTRLAERQEPEDVVQMLNDYFTEVVPIVFKYEGMLDKYLGDGLMAAFGVPLAQPDAALRAVVVALDMMDAVDSPVLAERMGSLGEQELRIGVGIAVGPVVAGNIGSADRFEFTCIGDTVNYAARLEALNRSLGTCILVSEQTRQAVEEWIPCRALPPIKIKGKRGEARIYAIHPQDVKPAARAALERRLHPGQTVSGQFVIGPTTQETH